MRILQVIQKTQLRGAEIFACQLSTEMIKEGHTVDIVFLFPYDKELIDQFPYLKFTPLNANRSRRFVDFSAYRRLKILIESGRYDLVQANAGDTLKYCAISKALHRWKAPLIFRNATKMSGFIRNRYHRLFNGLFLNQCKKYISVSENCRQDLIHLFPDLAADTITIPIGTYILNDIKPFALPVEINEPVFINIGSFAWEKNQTFLLDIFDLYYKTYGQGYLWILGEGRLRIPIEEKIQSLNLTSRVILWGSRRDVLPILKRADAFVMPSVIEGLPGVILEALACGVPVVASSVGGIPEVIRNNVNGYCIDDFEPEAYVKCMHGLVNDTALCERLTAAGHQTLEEGYLMPVIARRFTAFYQSVLAGKTNTPVNAPKSPN